MRAAGSGGEGGDSTVYLLVNAMPYFRTNIAQSRTPEDPAAQRAAPKTAEAVVAFAEKVSARGRSVILNVQGGPTAALVEDAIHKRTGFNMVDVGTTLCVLPHPPPAPKPQTTPPTAPN